MQKFDDITNLTIFKKEYAHSNHTEWPDQDQVVQQKEVTLKFKDNKNKVYEIKVDNNIRFNDALNELIGKHDMKRNEIKSITLGNKYLYLNSLIK